MNKLKKPNDDVENVFNDCISNIRDKALKAELKNCLNDIVLNSKDYDKLMSVPEYGICPYCGQGLVTTLDHYLAKTKFVSLVVTLSNLIPSCFDCNKAKTSSDFKEFTDTMINPYFDDLGEEIWLKAKVVNEKQDDFVVIYYVQKPQGWSDVLFKRVENHFNAFHLNRLYSSHAAQKLRGLKTKLIIKYKKSGLDSVLEYLEDGLDEYSYDLNCWQSALFSELLENSWIHEEWLEMYKE